MDGLAKLILDERKFTTRFVKKKITIHKFKLQVNIMMSKIIVLAMVKFACKGAR
jgi:hypothetical protein